MLEPIILDNTENLLSSIGERSNLSASTNLITGSSQMTCLARCNAGTSLGSYFANTVTTNAGSSSWNPIISNTSAFRPEIIAGNANTTGLLVINTTANTVSTENPGAVFGNLVEDSTGVVWGAATNSSYYGLWKRSSGSWAKIVSDSAAGFIYRSFDNRIFFKASAGTYYECTSGSAVVYSGTPPGLIPGMQASVVSNDGVALDLTWNTAAVYDPSAGSGIFGLPLGVLPAGWKTAVWNTYCTYTDPGSAPGRIASYYQLGGPGSSNGVVIGPVSFEFAMEQTDGQTILTPDGGASYTSINGTLQNIWRLNNTYALHTTRLSLVNSATQRAPLVGKIKIPMSILNKTTGISQYIGSLYLAQYCYINDTYAGIVGATLNNGLLTVWFIYRTAYNGTAADIYGLFSKSFTLNLNF